jgi:hypothetical protein
MELAPPGACRTRVEGLAPVTEASFPAAEAAGAEEEAAATAATGAALSTTGVGVAAGAGAGAGAAALTTGAEESPKLMLEPPPGGASTRLVGRVTLRSLDINLLVVLCCVDCCGKLVVMVK